VRRVPLPPQFVILPLILLAFFLRVFRIDWQSLWTDENFTVFLSGKELAAITQITSIDVHPPLYYYSVHFWMLVAGQTEFSVRFLSLFFALLLVPLTFKLGDLLVDRRVGILASLLTAIGPFQVYFAQEARMYSLMSFFSLLSIYAMFKVAGFGALGTVDRSGGRRGRFYWGALVLSSAGLLYAHYFGALVLVFQNTAVFCTRFKQRSFLLKWCLSQVMVLCLFAPWVPVMLRTYVTNDEDWRRFIPFLQMFQETMVNLSLGNYRDLSFYSVLASGFFIALLVGVIVLVHRRGARLLLLLLGLYLFQPIAITYLVSFNKPVFGAGRYLIFVAPALYLLVSIGLLALRARWKPVFVAVLASLVLTSGFSLANNYFNDAYAKDDYRALAKLMESKAAPDDGMVIINGLVFDYYYRGNSPRIFLPVQYPINQQHVVDELNRFTQGKSRVWMLRWAFNGLDPDDFIFHQLQERAVTLEDGQIRGLYYTLFKLDPDVRFGMGVQHPVTQKFDKGISVVGYSLSRETPVAGRTVDVSLLMKPSEKLDRDYKMSIFLTDNRGYKWAQEDRPPTSYSMSRWRVGETVEARLQLKIPLGMPPGKYTLNVVAYSPTGLEPLNVLDAQSTPVGTTLRLGEIKVERGQLPYAASAVSPSHAAGRDLAPGVHLLGYDVSAAEIDQGGNLSLVLYWQAQAQPTVDYNVSIKLVDDRGNTVQVISEKPHHGEYSTLEWRQDEIIRDVHLLQVGGATSPGRNRILVSLDGNGLQPADLGQLLVKEKARSFVLPSIQNPIEAELNGKIDFLGYALEGVVRPGGKIGLTLYWKDRTGGLPNYAVFTHLLDSQNRVWAQHDGEPAGGTRPTSGWVPGEVITDPHQLTVKPDAPPGEYVFEIGMYEPASGARLKLPSGEDRILLGKVQLEGAP